MPEFDLKIKSLKPFNVRDFAQNTQFYDQEGYFTDVEIVSVEFPDDGVYDVVIKDLGRSDKSIR